MHVHQTRTMVAGARCCKDKKGSDVQVVVRLANNPVRVAPHRKPRRLRSVAQVAPRRKPLAELAPLHRQNTPRIHAQTETVALSSNSIYMWYIPGIQTRPYHTLEFEEWLRFQSERGETKQCIARQYSRHVRDRCNWRHRVMPIGVSFGSFSSM